MNRLSILQDWRGIVLLVVCLASSLLLIHAIDHDMPQNHNDLIGRWVGTRAAFQGQSPYSEQTLQKIQTAYYGRPLTSEDKVLPQGFYYPAPAILFFWPTTWFNFATVRLSFLLIMPVLLLISFWQCFDIAKIYPPLRSRFLFCAIALSFLPTVWGLRLLQPTLLMIPPVIAACWLVAHEKTVLAGMILAPIMLKPQLILPLIVWLCFWTLLRHKPGFTISFSISTLILLTITERIVPGWLQGWLASIREYKSLIPKLPLQVCLGNWPGLIATMLITILALKVLWSKRNCSPNEPDFGLCIALVLALSVCLTITGMALIYNQVFLVPACLIACYRLTHDGYAAMAQRTLIRLLALNVMAMIVAAIGGIITLSTAWESVAYRNDVLGPVLIVTLALMAKSATNSKSEANQQPLHS